MSRIDEAIKRIKEALDAGTPIMQRLRDMQSYIREENYFDSENR